MKEIFVEDLLKLIQKRMGCSSCIFNKEVGKWDEQINICVYHGNEPKLMGSNIFGEDGLDCEAWATNIEFLKTLDCDIEDMMECEKIKIMQVEEEG